MRQPGLITFQRYDTRREVKERDYVIRVSLAIKRNAFSTRHLLSDPAATLNFVNATGRLTHISGDTSAEPLADSNR